MAGKAGGSAPSQAIELLLGVAAALGRTTDREIADLVGVTPENVAYWRAGQVRELKGQTLTAVKAALAGEIAALREAAGLRRAESAGGVPALETIEIEDGSGPIDLQQQLHQRVHSPYVGHGFLYFEPEGALAWRNLIRDGYGQHAWLDGVERCAAAWLSSQREAAGGLQGPIAQALGLDRRGGGVGLDLVALGPGEGSKEARILARALQSLHGSRLPYLTYAPVDVSISLLVGAAKVARATAAEAGDAGGLAPSVLPFCADFEEGGLHFLRRLPTSRRTDVEGVRLVLMLGNTFGNLRNEETFLRERLDRMVRPGDLVWLEVGLRSEPLSADPLYRATQPGGQESASEANRRLLLQGPYRRWEAAQGQLPAQVGLRISLREGDETTAVPGSVNFCHDLVWNEGGRRACTMLYSRRYEVPGLTQFLERRGYRVLRTQRVEDSAARARVVHLLLQRAA